MSYKEQEDYVELAENCRTCMSTLDKVLFTLNVQIGLNRKN